VKEKMIEFNGRTMNMTSWAADLGISRQALTNRFKSGMTLQEALSKNGMQILVSALRKIAEYDHLMIGGDMAVQEASSLAFSEVAQIAKDALSEAGYEYEESK